MTGSSSVDVKFGPVHRYEAEPLANRVKGYPTQGELLEAVSSPVVELMATVVV